MALVLILEAGAVLTFLCRFTNIFHVFRLEQELEQDSVADEEDNPELSFDFLWDDKDEGDNDSYIKDENAGLADMNPEEMLEFLKNKS